MNPLKDNRIPFSSVISSSNINPNFHKMASDNDDNTLNRLIGSKYNVHLDLQESIICIN
jgi:hypothetical protein